MRTIQYSSLDRIKEYLRASLKTLDKNAFGLELMVRTMEYQLLEEIF